MHFFANMLLWAINLTIKNVTQKLHFKVQYLFEKQSIKIGRFDRSPGSLSTRCFYVPFCSIFDTLSQI